MADGALEFRIVLATLSPTMAFCQVATWPNLPGAQATLFRTWGGGGSSLVCSANNCVSTCICNRYIVEKIMEINGMHTSK